MSYRRPRSTTPQNDISRGSALIYFSYIFTEGHRIEPGTFRSTARAGPIGFLCRTPGLTIHMYDVGSIGEKQALTGEVLEMCK